MCTYALHVDLPKKGTLPPSCAVGANRTGRQCGPASDRWGGSEMSLHALDVARIMHNKHIREFLER